MDIVEENSGVDPTTHWYYRSKAFLLEDMAGDDFSKAQSLVDVGAGWGFFARYLLERYPIQEITCVDPNYPAERVEAVGRKLLRFVHKPVPTMNIGGLILMDVLEHVVDDAAFLTSYTNSLAPGTPVFMTVPAFNFLWSAHDDALGHQRRYRLSELIGLAERAGLKVIKARYFYACIFPGAALIRLLRRGFTSEKSDLSPVPWLLNLTLQRFSELEVRLARKNRSFGLTAAVFAMKR